MSKPRLLDLFCGAGGAAKGYQEAGFYVVGVDNRPQPRYCGDEFYQGDAMTYPLEGFDFIHASPPCQKYSIMQRANVMKKDHPDLVDQVRDRLEDSHTPWVIENVPGAPLRNPIVLCGQSFGLRVLRHRLFEASFPISALPHVKHTRQAKVRGQHDKDALLRQSHIGFTTSSVMAAYRDALECPWMGVQEARQAIPPAYTRYIGEQFLAQS